MWKMPEMPVYGREVTIKIPENNPFLLGEMVTISETSGKKLKKNENK
jgi:HlyD family secretion protein